MYLKPTKYEIICAARDFPDPYRKLGFFQKSALAKHYDPNLLILHTFPSIIYNRRVYKLLRADTSEGLRVALVRFGTPEQMAASLRIPLHKLLAIIKEKDMGLFEDAINGVLGQHITSYTPYHELKRGKTPGETAFDELARLLRTKFGQETLDLSVLPSTKAACTFWYYELNKLEVTKPVSIIQVAGKADTKYRTELEDLVTNLYKRDDSKSLIPKNAKGCKFFLDLLKMLY